MGNSCVKTERIERIIPDPNNPGEMIKEIKKTSTCGCTSRLGRNGNSLRLNTYFEYKDTFTEDVSVKREEPLTTKDNENVQFLKKHLRVFKLHFFFILLYTHKEILS